MQNQETLVVKNPEMPNNEPTIKELDKIADTKVPIPESKPALLPSYSTVPVPTILELKPAIITGGTEEVQSLGTRTPIEMNPLVFGLMNKHERSHPSATLAGQFSDEITVDKKEPRSDVIDPLYFRKLPKNVLVQGRHQAGTLGARLVKPVNWKEINILREQPLTNLNDVNHRALQDISVEDQEKIITRIDKFRNPVETPWIMTERRQFKLPVRPRFSRATLIAQGKQKTKYHRMFPERNPIELVRKSIAVSHFVDNMFNASLQQPLNPDLIDPN